MRSSASLRKGGPERRNILTFASKRACFVAFVLLLALAAGCSAPAPELSAVFDEDAVKQKAQDVIALFNAQDTDAIREISSQTLKDALTDDVFSQIYAALGQGGDFVEVTNMTASGSANKSTGEQFAVVVAQAKYKNKSFTYTISFDTDMKLAGIYYK